MGRINSADAGRKSVVAGFDGFVDSIAKPVFKTGGAGERAEYFASMEQFGAFISAQSRKSASIELELLDRRMGGNMPNFCRGIAALGIKSLCIGMLSGPDGAIEPVFNSLPGEKVSYAPAGTASALEFEDGKLFLACRYALDGSPWERIEQAFLRQYGPSASLKERLQNADLAACLNWSELAFADRLWNEFHAQCAALFCRDKQKFMLFDICDFGRRTTDELKSVLSLIEKFSALRYAVLSLNMNEALLLAERLPEKTGRLSGASGMALEELAGAIFAMMNIDEIIIHSHHKSVSFTAAGACASMTKLCRFPAISTGAGDRFNAAYGFALLSGLAAGERLAFANLYARAYVSSGTDHSLESLRAFAELDAETGGGPNDR